MYIYKITLIYRTDTDRPRGEYQEEFIYGFLRAKDDFQAGEIAKDHAKKFADQGYVLSKTCDYSGAQHICSEEEFFADVKGQSTVRWAN